MSIMQDEALEQRASSMAEGITYKVVCAHCGYDPFLCRHVATNDPWWRWPKARQGFSPELDPDRALEG